MINKIKLPIWVCEECGSKDVQQQAWVELNAVMPDIEFFETNDREDFWCKKCGDHTNIIIEKS